MNLLQALAAAVGEANVLTGDDAQPFLTDWRKRYRGNALAVVRPGATAEVVAVVRACAAARTPMVPQGGNTGLVGGGTPDDSGKAVVISLQLMNRVHSIALSNNSGAGGRFFNALGNKCGAPGGNYLTFSWNNRATGERSRCNSDLRNGGLLFREPVILPVILRDIQAISTKSV